jgi:hypothetical protein
VLLSQSVGHRVVRRNSTKNRHLHVLGLNGQTNRQTDRQTGTVYSQYNVLFHAGDVIWFHHIIIDVGALTRAASVFVGLGI